MSTDKTTTEDQKVGEYVRIDKLHPHHKNPRHNDHAVDSIANSIKRFGFTSPIVANKDGTILAGHTRYKASKQIGLETVPVVYVDLSPVDAELLMIADNKLGEKADWDNSKLSEMLSSLQEVGEDLDVLGFEENELDNLLMDLSAWEDLLGDDEDFDNQVNDMESNVHKGLMFDFNQEDYERVIIAHRSLRGSDVYMGSTIVLALEKLNEEAHSTET